MAEQLSAHEQRQIEREELRFSQQMDLLRELQRHCLGHCDRLPATEKAGATGPLQADESQHAAAPIQPTAHPRPAAERQQPPCDLLVIGDSITKALSAYGLEKLTEKSTTISSNGGAVPDSIPLHEQTPTATDIVLHVGTNLIETDEQPGSIADSIFKRASAIRGMNTRAKVHISAIIKRTDLVDNIDNTDSIANANEKIETTNNKLKEKCSDSKDVQFIDNSNIGPRDLFDGNHLNKYGGSKLAKNISQSVNGKPNDSVPMRQRARGSAFKLRRPPTFGEMADLRTSRPTTGSRQNHPRRPRDYQTERDQSRDRHNTARYNTDRRRNANNMNNVWQTLPSEARELREHGDNRFVMKQQADFVNMLVNRLLNSCSREQY